MLIDEEKVNHPSHYTGTIECIDAMQSTFGTEAVKIYCRCNAFKYIWRSEKKNGEEDIQKAVWYLNKYLDLCKQDAVNASIAQSNKDNKTKRTLLG